MKIQTKIAFLFAVLIVSSYSFAQDGVRSSKNKTSNSTKKEIKNANKIKSATVDSIHVEQKNTNSNFDSRKTIKK